MSTNVQTNQEGTDPRPAYIDLGVDGNGAHHTYSTRTHTVHVVDDEGRTHAIDLGEKLLDEYMGFVDARRGWSTRRYGRSLAEVIADGFQGEL